MISESLFSINLPIILAHLPLIPELHWLLLNLLPLLDIAEKAL